MTRSLVFILMAWVAGLAQTNATLPSTNPLARAYKAGEVLAYRMQATNKDREGTLRYEATATVEVQKNAAGQFVEAITWSDYVRNGKAVPLNQSCRDFRQILSRSPGWVPSLPNLSEVRQLEGPVLDLLTLYVDLNDGKILSAVIDNPVEVRRRICQDAALAEAGEPLHYKIHRHIELALITRQTERP